jgi:hypothetical protein
MGLGIEAYMASGVVWGQTTFKALNHVFLPSFQEEGDKRTCDVLRV